MGSSTPSLVDVMTVVSGICLWFSTVIGFVWWLNNRFNLLLASKDYFKAHEQLEQRVRELEIGQAKIMQRVMSNQQNQMDQRERDLNK